MKRITEYEESLNIVRAKCESKNTDFTKEEIKHLSLANIELQKSYGKKFVKPLDKSCSYCVITAMNCIHNYINFEESKNAESNKAKNKKEVQKKNEPRLIGKLENKTIIPVTDDKIKKASQELGSVPDDLNNEQPQESIEEIAKLPLKELRKRFPNIKARSIDRFIELLKAE